MLKKILTGQEALSNVDRKVIHGDSGKNYSRDYWALKYKNVGAIRAFKTYPSSSG